MKTTICFVWFGSEEPTPLEEAMQAWYLSTLFPLSNDHEDQLSMLHYLGTPSPARASIQRIGASCLTLQSRE
jgi:hypothetical protein